MSNFKLIGIRPHEDCGEKFLKVLEPGRLYQFYNEYEFHTKDGKFDGVNGEITHCKIIKTVPDDLYKVGNLKLNISAVVGKNGTGKSTLIELLLYCIYYLGTNLENEKGEKILNPHQEHLRDKMIANQGEIDDYYKKKSALDNYVEKCLMTPEKLIKGERKKRFKYYTQKQSELLKVDFLIGDLEKIQDRYESDLKAAEIEHKFIIEKLKCSLFFEINEIVYEVKIDNTVNFNPIDSSDDSSKNLDKKREIKIISILEPKSTQLLNTFFYSIVLNYSHHSLNSLHLGYWINTLFHKNDGYKTPAVINPMREYGKFDINHENYLAKQRLLINLLIDCLVNGNQYPLVTEKQRILKVKFSFNQRKVIGNDVKVGDPTSEDPKDDFIITGKNTNLLRKIYGLSFNEDNIFVYNSTLPFNEKVHNYISDKLLKIEEQYPEYNIKWKDDDNIFSVSDRYVNFLVEDNSHITFKLKQALYFLEKMSEEGTSSIWAGNQESFEFELSELLLWMKVNEIKDLENIFKRIPPSIFNIDFILTEDLENPKPSFFEELSSGEQQKIHTTNSIIYHLNNLYSVHLSKSEGERIKYSYLNIILDEIELYYHPDLQRRFIHDLIETIKSHKHLVEAEYIKGLNFIFSTHSPFILSDIPEQNILKLEYNELKKYSIPITTERQTFGANIHDLLANSFFLTNSYKGKFAEEYFNKIVNGIKAINSTDSLSENEYTIWADKVDLIAEPFIKAKLFEILDSKFKNVVDPLNKKIGRMNEEIERLKREKEANQKKRKDDTD